ncbi:hypothetical protein RIB2604_03302890 [Aspergillus luchuensis]|uniref:Uncharacterized protein n=1 Tax=Aspergillus kawachii TaxID=1069201 RepID=A0A146G088_ASPKA|nr:hypothetical protein RIB2604_03302890 [Aspergillus luchuensis]
MKEPKLLLVRFRCDVDPEHIGKRASFAEALNGLSKDLPYSKPYNAYRTHSGDLRIQ